jgi:CBS domain-containing protein
VIAKKMRDYDVGAIPVCEDGKTIGMVTDRDIALRVAKDVMSQDVIFCRDAEDAERALRMMEDNKIRRLPVLNEGKKLVGMVSLGDISHALSRDRTAELTKAISAHHV